MIREPGDKYAHIYSASGGRFERVEQDMIGQKIGVRQPDRALSPANGLDVHIANREGKPQGIVITNCDHGVKLARIAFGDAIFGCARTIPEVDEGLREIRNGWSRHAEVGVSPFRGIDTPNVIAADETRGAINDQQLVMIQPPVSRINNMPGAANGLVFHRMNGRWEYFEGTGYDQVGKGVENDV